MSDLSPLAKLNNLDFLYLHGTEISDLSPLAELKNLKRLLLSRTEVSKEQIDELRLTLPNCDIRQ